MPVRKLQFETITIEDGLSQGMIGWMAQDHLGFIWFGTKDGLNRYDGSRFIVYRHDEKSAGSLGGNFVSTIFEDSKNRLWVVTDYAGLDLFDRATETFAHFTHDEKNRSSISSNNVLAVTEDRDGNVYVSTAAGLDVIKTIKDKKGNERIEFSQIDPRGYCKVFSAQKGKVWISPLNDSVYALTINNNKQVKENIPFVTKVFLTYPPKARQVQTFVYDSVNTYLYMLLCRDLVRYDEKKKEWKRMPGYTISAALLNSCAFIDNAGQIWIVDGQALYLYDTKQDATYIVSSDDPHHAQMLNNATYTLRDKSDNTWVGTKGYGVLKYNARASKFHHTGSESITGIFENNDGKMMIVTQRPYANLFDKLADKFTGLIPDTSAGRPLNNRVLKSAARDISGKYFLSYTDRNPVVYDPAKKRYREVPFIRTDYFPVYKTPGNKIIVCSPDTIYCFNTELNKAEAYRIPQNDNRNNHYDYIQAILQQNDSIYWLGTTAGLLQFNINNNSWKNFRNDPTNETSLSSNIIFSLCSDPLQPGQYLWIGTNGTGLNRMDILTKKFTHYTIKEGLPNDVIYGILSDDDHNLWLSTNKGLCRFTPQSQKNNKVSIINYEEKDGLQSNEFNRYAYCKRRDGTLFFGGINGFNYFNPHDLGRNKVVPNIVITDFKIGNKSISIHHGKELLSQPIELTDKIVLNYSDNMISFDFAALDFTQPSKNLYQYKMEGFDRDWIYSGTAHSATYTNLDPGTYTFHVKGSNSDGVWNEKGASIEFVILPPWYMTWWLRTLLAVAVIAASYLFYRYRLQHVLKLQAIRNKIASDLHDEIGSNLSSISIFSDVAKEETEGTSVGEVLSKISRYTRESMEAMSDIVWMINSSNDRFENVINRMREFAVELIEAKKCALQLNIDESLNNIKLGMEERKNFWLIYKEALNNTAKYANAKTVCISLQSANGFITLIVKDDGDGFDVNKIRAGNGLKNMQQRATLLKGELKIISHPHESTTIELKFKN